MPEKKASKPKPAQKRVKKQVKKASEPKPRKLAAPKGGERPITPMQKRFCEYLAQGNSQAEALRLAGSVAKNPEFTASKWTRLHKVTAYLQSLPQHQQQEAERQSRIATAQERQQILTTILRGEDQANFVTGIGLIEGTPTHTDKLRAADMLAKMNGEYTLNINMKVTQYAKDWLEDLFTILEEFVSPETVDAIAARIRTFNP